MSLLNILKAKQTERKNIADAAGALLTKAHTEKRSLTADERGQWEQRMADVDRLKIEADDLTRQVEAEQSLAEVRSDGRQAGREDIPPVDPVGGGSGDEHRTDAQRRADEKRSFRSWMIHGAAGMTAEQIAVVNRRNMVFAGGVPELEQRALSASTNSLGAYTVPVDAPYALEIALKSYGGIVSAADYIDTDNGALLPYPTMNDTANNGETIAESAAVGTTQNMSFGIINFNAYMSDSSTVLVPLQLLQDSAFDPETWMNDALRTRLGRRMNTLCTTGTGSNQPMGVLTAAPVSVTAASATAITYNQLLALEHSVDPAYRGAPSSPSWMFSDSTLKAIKMLVDSNGRPIFIAGGVSQGIQGKAPDTIDGFPYVINQDYPALAAGNKVISFGDFKKYKIRRVKQIQFVRFNELYMTNLQIGFLAFQRFDGNLIDAGTHPIQTLQMAAS